MSTEDAAAAARALPLLDLTDLTDGCDASAVRSLCGRARTPFGPVAAVCIWPRFVGRARAELGAGGPVRIATVVNFPSGAADAEAVAAETRRAVADGADEIDLVIPYRALMDGDAAAATRVLRAARAACPGLKLKAILESGVLAEPRLIAAAAELAVAAGADFLKTSTGKAAVNATPEAAEVMLGVARAQGRAIGFKAAGGLSSVAVAAGYLAQADRIMGPGWTSPDTFRFGASGLLDAILSALQGGAPTPTAAGY